MGCSSSSSFFTLQMVPNGIAIFEVPKKSRLLRSVPADLSLSKRLCIMSLVIKRQSPIEWNHLSTGVISSRSVDSSWPCVRSISLHALRIGLTDQFMPGYIQISGTFLGSRCRMGPSSSLSLESLAHLAQIQLISHHTSSGPQTKEMTFLIPSIDPGVTFSSTLMAAFYSSQAKALRSYSPPSLLTL